MSQSIRVATSTLAKSKKEDGAISKSADWRVAAATIAALVVVAVVHVGSWTDWPAEHDAINFYCALERYDISRDAPHPPGYPAYVGLGRFAALFIGPTHAYQAVNLAMLLGASALLGLIGARLASPAVGAVAALLLATSPLMFSATVTPECYVCDAFGSAAVAAWGLFGFRRSKALGLIGYALIFLFVGLTRAASCALLVPLALVSTHLGAPGDRRLLIKVVIAAGLATIGAYLLTVHLAGGLAVYRAEVDRVMGNSFRGSSMLGGASAAQHLRMATKVWVWFAIFAGPALLVFLASGWIRRSPSSSSSASASARGIGWLAAAWIVPMLSFYSLVYYLKPTYHVFYMPAIMLLGAYGVVRVVGKRPSAGLAVGGLLAALQLTFFTLGAPGLPPQPHRLTRPYFQDQDAAWRELAKAVGNQDPETLVIYRDHPSLTAWALRLITHDAAFASLSENEEFHQYLDGRWISPDQMDLSRYRRSLVIDRVGDQAAFILIDSPPDEALEGQTKR